MAKKKKQDKNKRKRQQHKNPAPPKLPSGMSWMDKERLHALLPGEPPSAEMMAVFNDNFRKELRNSPLWDEMVEKFGAEEAEKLLKQVKIELKR
jgi:hypothetical protein